MKINTLKGTSKFFLLFFGILLVLTFVSSSSYFTSNPNLIMGNSESAFSGQESYSFDPAMCQEGQDFLLQIKPFSCEPAIVRSDLLEEQDVPVFCEITALKMNPLMDVDSINSMKFFGDYSRDEVKTVGFYPSRVALGNSEQFNSLNSQGIGYAVIMLRANQNESSMPDFVSGNLTATIRYDVKNSFGIRDFSFYLPVLSENEWENNMVQSSFWQGRGYVRAETVEEGRATIALYSGRYANNLGTGNAGSNEKQKISSFNLGVGEKSNLLYLPGFECLAGLELRLDSVEEATTFAKLKINSEYIDVVENERFLDNKCYISKGGIEKQGLDQSVSIRCTQDAGSETQGNFDLRIAPRVELKIDGKESKYYSVGDKLFDAGENSIYLGYIGINPNSEYKDNEQVYIYLVSNPGLLPSSRLTNKMVQDVSGYAKSLESELGDNFYEDIGTLAKSYTSLVSRYVLKMFKGTDIDPVRIEDGAKKVFEGTKTIELIGFAGASNYDTGNETFLENYNAAVEAYEFIDESFLGEEYPGEEDIGEKALYNLTIFAANTKQHKDVLKYCEEFKEKYPNSEFNLDDSCGDSYLYSSVEIASSEVLIDGQNYNIGLSSISEPEVEDYGVEVEIKGPNDLVRTFGIPKNGIIYLDDFRKDGSEDENAKNPDSSEREYIMLKGLTADVAILKINLQTENPPKTTSETTVEKVTEKVNDVKEYFDSEEYDFEKGERFVSGGYTFTLKQINLKQYAKVSVLSRVRNVESEANFSFNIGIDKRLIQLSPEKTEKRIQNLNKTVTTLTKISDGLGTVVNVFDKSCQAVQLGLTVKNLLENSKGKAVARKEVMAGAGGWNERCELYQNVNQDYRSKEECLFDNAKTIEAEVDTFAGVIEAQDAKAREIQDMEGVSSSGGIWGDKKINTTKYMENYIPFATANLGTVSKDGETFDGEEMKKFFTLENWEKGYYSLDELKEVELYSNLAKTNPTAENMKIYEERMFSLVYDVGVNVDKYVTFENAKKTLEEGGYSGMTPYVVLRKDQKIGVYEGHTVKEGDFYGHVGQPIQSIMYDSELYYLILNEESGGIYGVSYVFDKDKKEVLDREEKEKIIGQFGSFEKQDSSKTYHNEYKVTPEVQYYEMEPYKGLPGIIPFDVKNGWFVYVQQKISTGRDIRSYDSSGVINSFWIVNVGEDGLPGNNPLSGDNAFEQYNKDTGQQKTPFPGLDEGETEKLYNQAIKAINIASKTNQKEAANDLGNGVQLGSPISSDFGIECTDYMSPNDCKLLFNVCDPVVCPRSRCDMGGKYPVQDVVQSGLIGSVALCLPNAKEGIKVPVCLTGVDAGVESLNSNLKDYQSCLQESLDTGRTVGICDEIHSIYLCEFIWKQAIPFAKVAASNLISSVLNQNSGSGGGEYSGFQGALQNAKDSASYFTNFYALESFNAFKFRSTEEAGGAFCKNFISVAFPNSFGFLDGGFSLAYSPPQFNARFEEMAFTTVTNPPVSHYKVYYHIYAGGDRGAYYNVRLRGDEGGSPFYQDIGTGRFVGSGYVRAGESVSMTEDFTAPSGFKELCVDVNGQEECGFGEVTTSFASEWLNDQYIQRQLEDDNVNSEEDCVSGSRDWYTMLNPNIQAGVENTINPAIYNEGIIRICASSNPGSEEDNSYQRWIEVGNCGSEEIKCYLDKESVDRALEFDYTKDQTMQGFEDALKESAKTAGKITTIDEFENNLNKLKDKNNVEKLKLISEIYDKVYLSNHKAYLLFLKQNVYSEIAKKKFDEVLIERAIKECEDQKEYLKLGDEVDCTKKEVRDEIKAKFDAKEIEEKEAAEKEAEDAAVAEELSARELVLKTVEDLVGDGVTDVSIYEIAGVEEECVYSDSAGRRYSTKGGIVITQDNNVFNSFLVNNQPTLSCSWNREEGENLEGYMKLDAIQPGDLLSYAIDSTSGNEAIFLGWVSGGEDGEANLFGWKDKNEGDKIYSKYTLVLSDEEHPVYMFLKPVVEKDVLETKEVSELEKKLDLEEYPLLEIKSICYKFVDGEWKWTNNCLRKGLDNLSPWTDVSIIEQRYGSQPSSNSKNTILGLRGYNKKLTFEEGFIYLIKRVVELNVKMSTDYVEMDKNKIFKLEGFEDVESVYFSYVDGDWYWSFEKLKAGEKGNLVGSLNEGVEITQSFWGIFPGASDYINVNALLVGEKDFINLFEKKDFVEGAKLLFSVDMKNLNEVIKSTGKDVFPQQEVDFSKPWTLERAITEVRYLEGKYSSNKVNEQFVDEICRAGFLTKEECDEIDGLGILGFGEEDMDYVKELLIRKSVEKYEVYIVPAILLKLNLIGSGDYNENKEIINLWKAQGTLSGEKYYEIWKDPLNKRTIANLVKYFEGKLDWPLPPVAAGYEEIEIPQEISSKVWTLNSAYEAVKSLTGKYNKHKELIDSFCEQKNPIILTKEECDEIDGLGILGFGEEDMDYVKDLLLQKMAEGSEDLVDIYGLQIYSSELESFKAFVDANGLKLDEEIKNVVVEGGFIVEYFGRDKGIKDISSLENLISLKELYLGYNEVSDISPLSSLINLKELYLLDNEVSDISPLSSLINLESLDLYGNKISDISFLGRLTNLEKLYLDNNLITDISSLRGLTSLTDLGLSSNQISDLTPLASLTNLKNLYLDNNLITDISSLSGLTSLQFLILSNNQISELPSLERLTNLNQLHLSNNQISDLTPLGRSTNLSRELVLRNNQIKDISPLKNISTLGSLLVENNCISPDNSDLNYFIDKLKDRILYGGNPRDDCGTVEPVACMLPPEPIVEKEEIPNAGTRVLTVVEEMEGSYAYIGKAGCFDAAEYIFTLSESTKNCVYSDLSGKYYSVAGGIYTTSDPSWDAGVSVYKVNPLRCTEKDFSEIDKLSSLMPGDMISYYSGREGSSVDSPHNSIFINWINQTTSQAKLFDWNGPTYAVGKVNSKGQVCEGEWIRTDSSGNKYCKTYRVFTNHFLSDDKNPVYLNFRPA